MNTRLIISLLCAGALAFACGPRSRSDASATIANAVPTRAADIKAPVKTVERASKTAARGDARLDAQLNVSVVQHEVKLALDVRNVGGKKAEIVFPSGQAYDFAVVDSTGREVWRWSKRHIFTQGVQNKPLGSGESLQVAETWKQGAKAGRYTAIATFKSANFPAEQRVEFVLQ